MRNGIILVGLTCVSLALCGFTSMTYVAPRSVVSATTTTTIGWADTNIYLWVYDGSTNATGDAADISGNNNTATNVGAFWFPVTNILGQAKGGFRFDGMDDYQVETSNSVFCGTGDYTIGMWFRRRRFINNNGGSTFAIYGSPGTRQFYNHVYGFTAYPDGLMQATYYDATYHTVNSAPVYSNQWIYSVVQWNGSAGKLYAYTNGISTSNIAANTAMAFSSADRFRFGTFQLTAAYYFQGDIFQAYAMQYIQTTNDMANMMLNMAPQ